MCSNTQILVATVRKLKAKNSEAQQKPLTLLSLCSPLIPYDPAPPLFCWLAPDLILRFIIRYPHSWDCCLNLSHVAGLVLWNLLVTCQTLLLPCCQPAPCPSPLPDHPLRFWGYLQTPALTPVSVVSRSLWPQMQQVPALTEHPGSR